MVEIEAVVFPWRQKASVCTKVDVTGFTFTIKRSYAKGIKRRVLNPGIHQNVKIGAGISC